MKFRGFLITLVILLGVLSACTSNTDNIETAESVKALVHDYSIGNKDAKNASTTSHQLIVTEDDGSEITYDLPQDEFFISIAPYINETHPCTNHSLTGCQAELVDEAFEVYIEDLDGNVIYDESVQTPKNGFIDLWLPRDKTLNVTIEHDGKIVTEELSTFEGDPTCITTMQLKDVE